MKIRMIAAMAKNRVIGEGNGLPWDIPQEYQHYLKTVAGATVIMGRKSFEIFGRDLGRSFPIVLTKKGIGSQYTTASGLDDALSIAEDRGLPVFIAGGASVYKAGMDWADEILLSVIRGEYKGDRYFPELDTAVWQLLRTEEYPDFQYQVWLRK